MTISKNSRDNYSLVLVHEGNAYSFGELPYAFWSWYDEDDDMLNLVFIVSMFKKKSHSVLDCHEHGQHDRTVVYVAARNRTTNKFYLEDTVDLYSSNNERILHIHAPFEEYYTSTGMKLYTMANAPNLDKIKVGESFSLYRSAQVVWRPIIDGMGENLRYICPYNANPHYKLSHHRELQEEILTVMQQMNEIANSLSDQCFSGWLDNPGAFSDFIIECRGKSFKCHRFVLACRSDFFAALFETTFSESLKGKVVINEISPTSMTQFILHIYANRTNSRDPEVYQDIVSIQHSYLVHSSKFLFHELVSRSLSMENVLKIAEIAFTHNFEYMKTKVIDFLFRNIYDMLKKRTTFRRLPLDCLKQLMDFLIFCHSHPAKEMQLVEEQTYGKQI